jgi:hypothetical protein
MACPRLVPQEARPWNPPETEFPAIVPTGTLLLGRSERAAVAITGIWAYSGGFEFFVTRIIRPGTPGWAPSGSLDFICPGLTPATGETRASIDAALILDAAGRSIQAWPERET